MEVGELVSQADITEIEEKCHFKEGKDSGPAKADESAADDDQDGAEGIQTNNGGILGDNVQGGAAGVADGGPYSKDKDLKGWLFEQKANDSTRGKRRLLRIKAYRDLKAGDFPFTVAAHHLIPGNACLYNGQVKLLPFLEDGGKVKTLVKKRKVTIEGHIGYDVNGSHNGVWLPGNYAIKRARPRRKVKGRTIPAREGTSPKKDWSWRKLGEGGYAEWQFAYVAGACNAAGGQFHDSHARPYSSSVSKELNKIVAALSSHLDSECTICSGDKVPPPFRIKQRLFAVSMRLRGFVMGAPDGWKKPWFTSERWSAEFFKGGKISAKFREAYARARAVRRGEPRDDDEDD